MVVLINDTALCCGDVGWSQGIGGRDERVRIRTTSRYGGLGFEDLEEMAQCSRRDRFAMPTDVDEVSAKFTSYVALDFCYDVMLQEFSGIIIDPVVLDDTHPLRLLVKHLKHPRPWTSHRLGADVIEEF